MSLKSTYKPSPGALAPLPLGWTEHRAPTGHTYYYNAETKESTYKRPVATSMGPVGPSMSFLQHQSVPAVNLSDPAAANAFMAQYTQPQHQSGHRGGFGGRGGFQPRPRPQPVDKPRSKVAIPGQEGWFLVYTKYGRRFAFNAAKNASYWRIPEKLKPGILELDQARIRQKAGIDPTPEKDTTVEPKKETESSAVDQKREEGEEEEGAHDYDSSEYEEVEVTDSEGEPDEDGNPTKRQRTEDPNDQQNDGPVEFTEEDIAAQLAAMGADYDEVEYNMSEEHEEPVLSDEDARELFKDLLNDYNINPYSPWEKLIEEGRIFDDPRYTVLNTMRSRKEVWEEWSRQKIQELKERRAKEEKKDPRIPYLAFLQEKATPKLYWPEFKRKYKKEDPMKDTKLLDKDREKMYREHINRIKLPQATLKADLKKLLESVPLGLLNNQTMVDHLPPQVLSDLRYISLDRKIRDPFIEGYIQGLPPPPEDGEQQEIDEATQKARDDRRKREKAMQDRERAVAEEKRRQEKKLQFERARLRDEERELERAMQVGKRGLQSQLVKEKGS
ncbi:Pre-mRNA-splicing factor dre4 [Diplogelasinospora grovesii]|uniref:Pre-mRNA-splicing factor dre4 n=1 Tax=Diplogelasinospora grovesii TaxID=303347 RepID=A0AAN6MY81_9PEZI|nr:Pre-mRNA-splicing factor dre4 [Diplogelasinospora grovesii]